MSGSAFKIRHTKDKVRPLYNEPDFTEDLIEEVVHSDLAITRYYPDDDFSQGQTYIWLKRKVLKSKLLKTLFGVEWYF